MTQPASTSSTPLHLCKWDYCTRSFDDINSLLAHFEHDHVPLEKYEVATQKRRKRRDGHYVVVGEPFRLSQELPIHSGTTATTNPGDTTNTTMTTSSSLPFSQMSDSMPTALLLPPRKEEDDADFMDRYLKSPSPSPPPPPPVKPAPSPISLQFGKNAHELQKKRASGGGVGFMWGTL